MIMDIDKITKETLKLYFEFGIPPGSFVYWCLCNNLMEAAAHADIYNKRCLCDVIAYIYNNAPRQCWGSPEKVDAWIENSGSDEYRQLVHARSKK